MYRQYLQDLLTYLEQFYDRTNPLGSLTKVYGKLGFDFDSAFEEGQVPGWEDRGAGKLPGLQGSAMDLQAFDTVDELESLGQHHHNCMFVHAHIEHLCSTSLRQLISNSLTRGNCVLYCKCCLLANFVSLPHQVTPSSQSWQALTRISGGASCGTLSMHLWLCMWVVAYCMELQPAQELQPAGADALKDALAKLGLKCGGTLRQRAERLILTKSTPLEKLDRKLFAKGVVPAVRHPCHVPFHPQKQSALLAGGRSLCHTASCSPCLHTW